MEPAGRRASYPPSSATLRRPVAQRVALALLVIIASFAVVYLIAANVILRTRFLRDVVSRGDGVELNYASAYSVWPGLVHLRSLSLEVQDYGIQFAVLADSGVVKVSLHDLLLRRFHATRVDLQGLAFRLRPKVQPSEAKSARVAAFPPIAGFADPPLVDGPKPPPTPDAEYDLWQVSIDDVHAELRELWFMEYRYLGTGRVARGGFRVQPGRAFAIYPAQVLLGRGVLSVGDAVAVQRLELDLQGYVDSTDVRQVRGAALAEKVSGRIDLNAHGIQLGAFDSHAGERRPRVSGTADLNLAASVSAGRIDPQGQAELTADRLSISTPVGKLSGSLTSNWRSLPDGRQEWVTTSPRLSLTSSSPERGPTLEAPRLALVLQGETIGSAPSVRELDFDAPELVVPSLEWAKRWVQLAGAPIEVAGRIEGRAHLSFVSGRGPAARVHLRLKDGALATESVRAALGGRIDAEIEPAVGAGAGSAGRVDVELDGVEVERVRQRTKPFRATVRLPDVKISLEPELAFSTGVTAYANPADSLLSVALGSPMLEDLAADVFDLRRLEAQAQLNVNRRAVRFELARAKSGELTGSGYWQRPATGGARGAFLISSKVANVGISLVGSDTETAWFVGDDWLASGRRPSSEQAPRDAPRRPGEKKTAPAKTTTRATPAKATPENRTAPTKAAPENRAAPAKPSPSKQGSSRSQPRR
jgi:hypothetical protein